VSSELALPAPRLRVVRLGERSPASAKAARAKEQRSGRRVLATLTLAAAVLVAAGLVMVLSASSVSAFARYGSSFLFFKRQLLYAGIGGLAAFGASRIDYHVWQRAWAPLFAVTFVLLILVLHSAVGTTVAGSARWIGLGPVSFQPSELAKLVVVTGAASILSRNMRSLDDPIAWLPAILFIAGSLTGLVLLQPDLGTATVILLTVFVLMFVAGVRLRTLVGWGMLAGAAGAAFIMRAPYRRVRFLSFLHPWQDPKNTGYQIVQSLIALGSGHVVGVGLGASRQKWMILPNAQTDFIFSILGEELGLIGGVVVLALFGALCYAGIRIALRSPDAFGRLLAAGITAWIGLQAVINLGAVTGLLPITGVPLPFVSFGGTSLIVSLTALGVLASVGRASLATRSGSKSGASKRTPARRQPARRPASRTGVRA
jgi:cell division protein FtsW